MEKLKTYTAYVSMETDAATAQVFWRLVIRNELAACGYLLKPVLRVARERLGRGTVMDVWDADRGLFTSELVADESC